MATSNSARFKRRKKRFQPTHHEVLRVYDQIYATVYGQCIGDALGVLTETLSKEDIKRNYQQFKGRLEFDLKRLLTDAHRRYEMGDWTEESDQMILILQCLIDNYGKLSPKHFGRKLMDWSEQGFPILDDTSGLLLCSSTRSVLAHPQFSEEPQKAAEIVWRKCARPLPSNTAVARCSVLGVHHYNHLGKVIKYTLAACTTTHADPRCQASCVAVTTAISLLLQANPKHMKKKGTYHIEMIIADAFSYASKCLQGTADEMKELRFYMYPERLKYLRLDDPGMASYTYKALGAGFWALRQKDFRQALEEIVFEGGDSDANAAVAGALLGCKLGLDAMPTSWIENLLHRFWLDDHLDRYFHMLEGGRLQPKHETAL